MKFVIFMADRLDSLKFAVFRADRLDQLLALHWLDFLKLLIFRGDLPDRPFWVSLARFPKA